MHRTRRSAADVTQAVLMDLPESTAIKQFYVKIPNRCFLDPSQKSYVQQNMVNYLH